MSCFIYHYAECRALFTIILNVIMQNGVMVSVALYLPLCWMSLCRMVLWWVLRFIYHVAVLRVVMLSVAVLRGSLCWVSCCILIRCKMKFYCIVCCTRLFSQHSVNKI